MIENIKIKTRSFNLDYDTFNTEQFGSWWEKYKDFYNDESNGIYIEIQDGTWRIFFDKIESNRKDNVGEGRPLYFSLEGSGSVGNDDYKSFLKLISFVLTNTSNKNKLSQLFNREFTADFINSLDKIRHTEDTDKAVKQKLDTIFSELPDFQSSANVALTPNSIIVAKSNSFNIQKFISQIRSAEKLIGKSILVYTDSWVDKDLVNKLVKDIQPERGFIITSQEEQDFEGTINITHPFARGEQTPEKKAQDSTDNSNCLTQLKHGLMKSPKIMLISLLTISLIINLVLIISNPSSDLRKELSIKNDSLCILNSSYTKLSDSLKMVNNRLDSLNSIQYHGYLKLDLSEFHKTGTIKTLVTTTSDTIVTLIDTDSLPNKCKVRVFKNGVQKGNQIPIDLK